MLIRGWETLVALVTGISGSYFLKSNFFDHAAGQIVTLLGLLMAGVIPTMILTVNSMKSSSFSINQIRSLRKDLEGQISLLGGLFLYALVACISVVLAVSTNWPSWNHFSPFSGIICFLLVFLVMRSFKVIVSIRGLLRLAGDLAEAEALLRSDKKEAIPELDNYENPRGYGGVLDIKH